jgi:hypothetical protein
VDFNVFKLDAVVSYIKLDLDSIAWGKSSFFIFDEAPPKFPYRGESLSSTYLSAFRF